MLQSSSPSTRSGTPSTSPLSLLPLQPAELFAKSKRVLSIGDDQALLATRQLVLQSAGYEVQSVSAAAILAGSKVSGFDLAILCHTTALDQAAVIQSLLAADPELPILLLAQVSSVRSFEGLTSITPDPRLLLDTARKMLRERKVQERSRA